MAKQKDDKSTAFVLQVKDPFAEGSLRFYALSAGVDIDTVSLPFELDAEDKVGRAAIENYIVRAKGAGRYDLADKAGLALVGKAAVPVSTATPAAAPEPGIGGDPADYEAEYEALKAKCLTKKGTPRSRVSEADLARLAELKVQLDSNK